MRSIAAMIERRGEVSKAALRQMAGAKGSIGGTRPKANVMDAGQPWIAKFSSATDTSPVERIEVATLQAGTGSRPERSRGTPDAGDDR